MAATMTPRAVSPLDMRELRKTQRRVATLLGQSPRLALPNIDVSNQTWRRVLTLLGQSPRIALPNIDVSN